MNKKQVLKTVWQLIIFIALAVGINNAAEAGSNSVWFLIATLIAHVFIVVKKTPFK